MSTKNWLADVSTPELERRLAKYQEGSREQDFVEADRILAELKARRMQNIAACAEAARSAPDAADRFSLSI